MEIEGNVSLVGGKNGDAYYVVISIKESESESDIEVSPTNMPDGMVIDETQWESWKSENKCSLFPFMKSVEEAGFNFSVPHGQGDTTHKTVDFYFKDNGESRLLENVDMYYDVIDQKIVGVGLYTKYEKKFESDDFKATSGVLNLTRERAEEIVNYCLENVDHCIVDNMRINVTRNKEEGEEYFSFDVKY